MTSRRPSRLRVALYTLTDYARAIYVRLGGRVKRRPQWAYARRRRFSYGDDTSYAKAIAFLDGFGKIEDWGCGTAYASKFVRHGPYWGVDGSEGYADEVADLATRRSKTPCLLMRHVLEHNTEWAAVLDNALASFTKRMVLVLYTPFAEVTRVIADVDGVPEISFARDDIVKRFAGVSVEEEELTTDTKYGREHVFYLRRD